MRALCLDQRGSLCSRPKAHKEQASSTHLVLPVTTGSMFGKPCGALAAAALVDIKALKADGICCLAASGVEHNPACTHRTPCALAAVCIKVHV
jgi:hypothetical protein